MVRVQIQLDPSRHRQLKKRAKQLGVSVAEIVRRSIDADPRTREGEATTDRVRATVQQALAQGKTVIVPEGGRAILGLSDPNIIELREITSFAREHLTQEETEQYLRQREIVEPRHRAQVVTGPAGPLARWLMRLRIPIWTFKLLWLGIRPYMSWAEKQLIGTPDTIELRGIGEEDQPPANFVTEHKTLQIDRSFVACIRRG